MIDQDVMALLKRAEAGTTDDPDFVSAMLSGIGARLRGQGSGRIGAGALVCTEDALALVAAVLPGWQIALNGHARTGDGRWTCTLRESGARDDDEQIGTARAPTPALALSGALLAALARAERVG